MKSEEQLEKDFRKDLELLLKKHNAEMTITDDNKPYGMQSPIVTINITGTWDDKGETTSKGCEFNI